MKAVGLAIAFSALALGCEPAEQPSSTFTVRDSAGITIVESIAPIWTEPSIAGWRRNGRAVAAYE